MKRALLLLAATSAALFSILLVADAATVPVLLDPTFGANGRALLDVSGAGGYEDEPFSMAVQPDGNMVIAGKARNPSTGSFDATVLRYRPNGTLDPSFGQGGIVLVDFVGGYDEGLSVALQPDGKIVIAGRADRAAGNADFGIARLNANGSRDGTFGWGGIVMTDFFGGADTVLGVAVQVDGKIVAAGFAYRTANNSEFALARYNANGSRDGSFGWGGLVTTDFAGSNDAAMKIALQPDGRIVAVGMAFNPKTANHDMAVARYNANGGRDASFGWGGLVMRDFLGGTDIAWAVTLQADGKIVAAGYAFNPAGADNDAAIMRLNTNGSLDTGFAAFGAPGIGVTDVSGEYDQILWLAIQPDGKIIGAGHSVHPATSFDFALFRYNQDGSPDATFGSGGHVTTDFFGGADGAHALALFPDGAVVLVGDAYNPGTAGDDFALARYLVADPSWISGVVSALPGSAFAPGSSASQINTPLATAAAQIAANAPAAALVTLKDLRPHVDSCGGSGDYLADCVAQAKVLVLLNQVIAKLGG